MTDASILTKFKDIKFKTASDVPIKMQFFGNYSNPNSKLIFSVRFKNCDRKNPGSLFLTESLHFFIEFIPIADIFN